MSDTKTVVLVGGGHTHALLLRQWAAKLIEGVALHVFDPYQQVPYTGMLPGFVAGHYAIADLYIDIQALTHAAGGTFHHTPVESVDPIARTLTTATDTLTYDSISFDVGIHTDFSAFTKTTQDAVGVKPLTAFARCWPDVVTDSVQQSHTERKIVVVGGGVAGVEVTLAMAHRLRQETGRTHQLTLLERDRLLPSTAARTRSTLKRSLAKYGVEVREGVATQHITADTVTLTTGEILASDFTLFATGPQPYDWIGRTGLPTTDGYINVDATLRSPTYPEVFAVGDCAHFLPRPLPKAGVYAVREAPTLYHNIRASIAGTPLQQYTPQTDYLKLISLGEKRVVADKWGLSISGSWLWWLKNRIDTKFMRQFTND